MKYQRAIATLATIAALGGAALTAQQASAAPSSVSAIAVSSAVGSAEDGRALFAGLFFLQGEVGDALEESPYFSDPSGELQNNESPEARAATEQLLDSIATTDADFFASFSTELRSGVPQRVEAGLNAAGEALRGAVSTDEGDVPVTGAGQGRCLVAIAVAAVNSVAAVNLGAAVNVVVAANVLTKVNFWFGVAPEDAEADPIAAEQAVADLTSRLAV
ncbi:hypothetical protein [Streptomyces sp. NPDC060198]|uniref:hypothetical protein n=1 Tax=Streptomyces sp. NPDC060198 TaxID=3347070 RepID=UPI00366A1551